jgi:hypothetical protein
MMGRAKGSGRHQRRPIPGEPGGAVDARCLKGLGEGHRRQDSGEPPGQHRFARPRRSQKKQIMVRTPAYHFASPVPLGMPMDPLMNLFVKLPHQYEAIS